MSYYIFLDDERIPKQVNWVDLPMYNWTIVRSYEQFVKCIKENSLPKAVSIDHDLGKSSYEEYHRAILGKGQINYDNITEKTGYHCIKWLIEYCLDNNLEFPREYYIHSMNVIGVKNIQSLIDSYYKSIGKQPIPATSPNIIDMPPKDGGIFIP
jgi:hypothetical protein